MTEKHPLKNEFKKILLKMHLDQSEKILFKI